MTLKKYQQKRNFKKTSEPSGKGKINDTDGLAFVVQKHQARNLHYDLRLELDGVLKSFAVPKGPSLKVGEMRLAIEVEDHPISYASFEGEISEGEYGAGKVEIWDEGTYFESSVLKKEKKDNQDKIREGFKTEKMKLRFKGQKMKGDYALFKIRKGEKNWLLKKIKS